MTVGDARLEALLVVRLAEPAGVGELKADDQIVRRAVSLAVRGDQASRAVAARSRVFASVMMSWFGFARPSGRTAIASPPQISFAPLSPKRCQRRTVSSVGPPSSCRPNLPSAGCSSGCRCGCHRAKAAGQAARMGR